LFAKKVSDSVKARNSAIKIGGSTTHRTDAATETAYGAWYVVLEETSKMLWVASATAPSLQALFSFGDQCYFPHSLAGGEANEFPRLIG
jgi:hypothetical protein